MTRVSIGLRVLLAAVLLWAALPKLADPTRLAVDVQNYRVLPAWAVGPVALGLPVFELVLAAALLVPAFARGAALLGAVLMAAFALAMAQARVRGIDLACGCFGAAFDAKVSWLTVARSAGLCAVAVAAFVLDTHLLRTRQTR